jgi:hypothetical protein
LQNKFNKRAFKEILDICTTELSDGTKIYNVMYKIDGEIIEKMDEVNEDTKLLIVSDNSLKFEGIVQFKEGQTIKDLKIENAKDVKKRY